MEVKLEENTKRAIETILSRGKSVEVGVRNDKVIVWEIQSKKKYETPVTLR